MTHPIELHQVVIYLKSGGYGVREYQKGYKGIFVERKGFIYFRKGGGQIWWIYSFCNHVVFQRFGWAKVWILEAYDSF